MPTKFPADGNTRVVWIEGEDGIADINAPTEEELNAGVDLSCDIMSGGMNWGIASGTIEGASVCSGNVAQSTGRTTVSPTLGFWRYLAPDDTAWETIGEKGLIGYLVRRTGYDYDEAWADGQGDLLVGLFQTGEPVPQEPGGDTNSSFDVNFNLVNGREFTQHARVGGIGS
jgi:hypothetical protein